MIDKTLRVINEELIEIAEYKNANACFITNDYEPTKSICTYKKIINPFTICKENERLNNIINKAIEYIKDNIIDFDFVNSEYPNRKNAIDIDLDEKIIKDLVDILKGDDKDGKN